ncbi:MAG: hypothetical protein ABL974_20100 [Prosthecobacter sp.]
MSAKRSKPRKSGSELGTCSAKLGVRRKKKKTPKAVDEKPLEVVTMTEAEKKELWGWLRVEMLDPNFKPVDPVRLNHGFLKFMAQVAMVLNLKPMGVQKYSIRHP